jgi:type III restriction enzyme
MDVFNPLKFQRKAVDDLLETFVRAWKLADRQIPIVFKSPTGSGKTFTVANFVRGLNHLPQWKKDKAFVWITFSDDLAMQSRDKFRQYFENNLENNLLTVSDINRGKMYENDILFLNWQKITARNAESRILRRPDDEMMFKESGLYWEDFIENTKKDGRQIILIIDESHKNKDTELAKNEIDKIDPKIILHVSATPNKEDELVAYRNNTLVEVKRDCVVAEGLIKEKIIVQTDEDLQYYKGKDLDEVLLSLGMEKREEIKTELEAMGKIVNPLMLIQLPNDDKKLKEKGIDKTKEKVVCDYLKRKGVKEARIAKWFDGRQENMDYITENDSDVDFMLFKQAAGTGWDCPRACVLVMFREIKKEVFYVQTIGRILRMPEPQMKDDYKNNAKLRTGYLFTNYKREMVEIPDQDANNKANTKKARRKKNIENVSLKSAYISRVDYGDIPRSMEFQQKFAESLNKFFGITSNDILGKARKKLEKAGIDLSGNLTNKIIANAQFEDYDQLAYDFKERGIDYELEMSTNDVEKTFNYICYQLLKEQTDEKARFTNIARSWSVLKSGIRIWFKTIFGEDSDYYYRIFVADINRGAGSKFRVAITQALKDFRPIAKKMLLKKQQEQEERESPIFTIQDEYGFTDDYVEEKQKLCVLDTFYALKSYSGKENEMRFKYFIDEQAMNISWWFKNGDYGRNYFAIKYFNNEDQKEALFYPDWIIKFVDGGVGIFDTKEGDTATSQETKDKASALHDKIKEFGKNFVGGIAVFENGVWYYNDSAKYEYVRGKVGDDKNWKLLDELLVFKQ